MAPPVLFVVEATAPSNADAIVNRHFGWKRRIEDWGGGTICTTSSDKKTALAMEKQEQTLFNDLRHMEKEVPKNIYCIHTGYKELFLYQGSYWRDFNLVDFEADFESLSFFPFLISLRGGIPTYMIVGRSDGGGVSKIFLEGSSFSSLRKGKKILGSGWGRVGGE